MPIYVVLILNQEVVPEIPGQIIRASSENGPWLVRMSAEEAAIINENGNLCAFLETSISEPQMNSS